MSSLPARMRLIKSKMKELECSQDFSHYKSMGIFPDAQGQLTPQSLVRSNQISNSVKTLWLSSLPVTSSPKGNNAHLRAIIQSEKKWKHQFFRRIRAASSVVRGRIWPNFQLIQALMYVIITCKCEKDPIKNNREKAATPFFKL